MTSDIALSGVACTSGVTPRQLVQSSSENDSEGIALAKQRGAYRCRKKALAPEQVAQLRRRAAAGEKKAQLAREFGISRETVYQYLRTDD